MSSKSLKVFGLVIKISLADLEDQNLDGEYKVKEKVIYLDKNIKGRDKMHTILHELGHALFARMGWKQAIPHELEEVIVDTYATLLLENFDIRDKRN